MRHRLRLTTTPSDCSTGAVAEIRGEVDANTTDALREYLLAEIDRHDSLILDVSGAMFLDTAGLRVLWAAQREALSRGGAPLTLRGVRPSLAEALRVTGIAEHFPEQQWLPTPASRRPRRVPLRHRHPSRHPEDRFQGLGGRKRSVRA